MNAFKNKLYNHQIKPSANAWERIEADLDKGKVRRLPLNVRWAAAAMFVFAVSGAITWKVMQKPVNQNFVKNENKILPQPKIENTAPVVPQVQKESVVSTEQKTINQTPTPNQFIFLQKEKIEKNNVVEVKQTVFPNTNMTPILEQKNIFFEKRNTESVAFLNQNTWRYLDINPKNIEIPRIQTIEDEEEEDDTIVFGPLNLPKIRNEKGDSTFTERVLAFGEQKAKQVVSRAFKPVIKRFRK
jgi:hypothetical protein